MVTAFEIANSLVAAAVCGLCGNEQLHKKTKYKEKNDGIKSVRLLRCTFFKIYYRRQTHHMRCQVLSCWEPRPGWHVGVVGFAVMVVTEICSYAVT